MRWRAHAAHSSTERGTRASALNSGPSIGSVGMLSFRLGLPKVPSVAGDSATAASGARKPWSRTQAISDSARLPPAESPAT